MTPGKYRDLGVLLAEYEERREAIRLRLDEFAAVTPSRYFYELAYCLMTPQSSAVHANRVQAILETGDALHRDLPLADILRVPQHYIRFHNTKARRIAEARTNMNRVTAAIIGIEDAAHLRRWLVENVKGLGWKEASHFLRNIGRRNLAILDRHILRNLVHHGAIRTFPTTLTPARYLWIENRFVDFSAGIGISLDELDLLFWSRETGQILK
jgi:N-glycosylase/DNA lyase